MTISERDPCVGEFWGFHLSDGSEVVFQITDNDTRTRACSGTVVCTTPTTSTRCTIAEAIFPAGHESILYIWNEDEDWCQYVKNKKGHFTRMSGNTNIWKRLQGVLVDTI